MFRSYILTVCALTVFSCQAQAERISAGDYVITTTRANVKSGETVLTRLARGTYFRVRNVHPHFVEFKETIDGEEIWGFVNGNEVLRIPKEYTGKDGSQDSLEYGAAVYAALPVGKKVGVTFYSTGNIDLLIMSESEFRDYQKMLKRWTGVYVEWKSSCYARKDETVYWVPPDRQKYYAVFDNTHFPHQGVNLRKNVKLWYAISTRDSNRGKHDISD